MVCGHTDQLGLVLSLSTTNLPLTHLLPEICCFPFVSRLMSHSVALPQVSLLYLPRGMVALGL